MSLTSTAEIQGLTEKSFNGRELKIFGYLSQ
ncbi:uncharacterized protein FFMR_00163 [Fusarium fujikuroi]|nr:uncharacterized protein FFC1_02062 [Fusarium fujikuroi]SCO12661.1 uncharacterized protein FFM5_10361 [Fusarium fujikuroi]SCO27284.1 uncharacterized protein FFMR_00163 [Fusarium fujikuroi]SCO47532.1 uncharacterized protein FFNC_11598 [Fusarium fujikuroi]